MRLFDLIPKQKVVSTQGNYRYSSGYWDTKDIQYTMNKETLVQQYTPEMLSQIPDMHSVLRKQLADRLDEKIEHNCYHIMCILGNLTKQSVKVKWQWLKKLITKLFGYKFTRKIHNLKGFEEYIIKTALNNGKPPYKFIVVNYRMASIIMEMDSFAHFNPVNSGETNIYYVGNLLDRIQVFVHPRLIADDDTILFGRQNEIREKGLHYLIANREINDTQMADGSKAMTLTEWSTIVITPGARDNFYYEQLHLTKSIR
jgi:hypothetical protein